MLWLFLYISVNVLFFVDVIIYYFHRQQSLIPFSAFKEP